jgi:hypothetical protein
MWFKYAHPTWPAWHYTSPTGAVPDLHHALLGNKLGGGIAFELNSVCDPGYGYGLSANLLGDFVSMSSSAVRDMVMVSTPEFSVISLHHIYVFSPDPTAFIR